MSHLQQHTGKCRGSFLNSLVSSSLWCRAFVQQRQCLSLYSILQRNVPIFSLCQLLSSTTFRTMSSLAAIHIYVEPPPLDCFEAVLMVLSDSPQFGFGDSACTACTCSLSPCHSWFYGYFYTPLSCFFSGLKKPNLFRLKPFQLSLLSQDEGMGMWSCHSNKLTGLSLTCGNRSVPFSENEALPYRSQTIHPVWGHMNKVTLQDFFFLCLMSMGERAKIVFLF